MIAHMLTGRRGAAIVLLACAVVEAVFAYYVTTAGNRISTQDAGQQVFWAVVSLALLFGTWRRSRGAWVVLLALTFAGVALFVVVALSGLALGGLPRAAYATGAAFLLGLEGLLLLSPAVRTHVCGRAVLAGMRER